MFDEPAPDFKSVDEPLRIRADVALDHIFITN